MRPQKRSLGRGEGKSPTPEGWCLIPGKRPGLQGWEGVSAQRNEKGEAGRGREADPGRGDPETLTLGEAGRVQEPGGPEHGAPRLGGGGTGQLPGTDPEMSRRKATWG